MKTRDENYIIWDMLYDAPIESLMSTVDFVLSIIIYIRIDKEIWFIHIVYIVIFNKSCLQKHVPGPVVSKHGNLGPVVRARGAGSPTDR